MRTIVNAVISFKMVAIPVAVAGTMSSTKEPKFKTLHSCGEPVKQSVTCPACEEEVLDTLKGYEVAKGQFVTFTPEELEGEGRDPNIELTKFVLASKIPQLMVEKTYWLVPPENEKLAEKYGLLYQTLAETKKAGIGSQSLWGKETPCVVRPNSDFHKGVLQLDILHLNEDLIEPDFSAPIPGREEKKMAKLIIDAMTDEFDPETDLISEHRWKVQQMISARMEDKELPVFEKREEKQEVDLMGALKASVEEIEKKKVKANGGKQRKAVAKK